MRLTKLITAGDGAALQGEDRDIAGIAADSRKVEPGFLFVAIPGTAHDGRAFIPEAIQRGAVAVLLPSNPPPPAGEDAPHSAGPNITTITTPHIRKTVSAIAAKFYPRQPETIAAITGTSGKTSTAQFAREIWQYLGHKSASIGTLGLITAKENRYGSLTTPDAINLHRLLDETAGGGITHLALEASSHGLAMNRLDNVHIKVAAFTNLSHDHLDFHGTMNDYLAAKLRLFDDVLPKKATAVLNADATEFETVSEHAKNRYQDIITYGLKGKEIRLTEVKPDAKGQVLHLDLFGKHRDILLPVIGKFQAWNALCALGIAVGSGEDDARAATTLGKITGVPGRLQMVGHTKNGAIVFVDYAHKPDALEHVLTAVRPHVEEHKGAKLGVVFGCGGNRDHAKRPMMGAIARRLADWVIVTDDNPRNEDPAAIRKQILAGCRPGAALREIGDRAQAIATGIGQLQPGDILIIAGKGHEPGQIIGDKTFPFDDAAIARQVLK